MQTLNVGAGKSDTEYQETEQQRRAELLEDSKRCAGFFFIATGLSAFGTGILPIRFNVIVTIGFIDLLDYYIGSQSPLYRLAIPAAACLWAVVLVGLGLAARNQQRWAFWAGIALYGVDMIMLIMTFSMWSFALHALFVYQWYKGQKALHDIGQEPIYAPGNP